MSPLPGLLLAGAVLGGSSPPCEELPITITRVSHCILLKAEIGGRAATLILDTGASNTILSSELLGPASTPLQVKPLKGSGLVGTGRWRRATIRIGRTVWVDHRVLEMDGLQDVSRGLKESVDGILGEDLLADFRIVIINYLDRTVTLAR